jgi:ATP-dependent DNA helicase RecQ
MDTMKEILKRHWGYESFLPLQREAMQCVMDARDSLVILPTGGGKSLCFQAPAMAMNGMALVISPLLSLMKDQVDALRTNGIPAAKFDSSMSGAEKRLVNEQVRERKLKLLYVSPERVVQPAFTEYVRETDVSFLVVDEAHCISHWGHDFRPEYRELRRLRDTFPGKAIHAYTATATQHVREDIERELCLRDPAILLGSYDRLNLVYRVQRRTDGYAQIRTVIEGHDGESGIIYCIRRADVDALCKRLAGDGFKALPYHAGMDDASRKRNQEAFARDDTDIIVATVAFGMGIDKSDVRYVLHAAMPKSIEHYHQETGRAGRDGLRSDCCLLYSYADYKLWEGIIEKREPEGATVAKTKLRDMLRYCERAVCRHNALVSYFGEQYPQRTCGACDLCLGPTDVLEDAASVSRAILSCVSEVGSIAGPTYTTLVLTGSREERVIAKGHQRLSSYGALASSEPAVVRDWIEQLVRQGYLEKTGEYNVLTLTQKGTATSRGEETPVLSRPPQAASVGKQQRAPGRARLLPSRSRDDNVPARAATSPPAGEDNRQLFEKLRTVRRKKAEELEVPPFVIFSDATLRDMAQRKPLNKTSFLAVHGVGERKCEAFGADFLAVIRESCATNPNAAAAANAATADLDHSVRPIREHRSRSNRLQRAAALLAQEQSIGQVAETLGRKPSTVAQYLVEYIQQGGITDPTPWVTPSVFALIREAVATVGAERLSPIHEHLNGEVDYGEIRICMACLRNLQR